MIRPNNVPPEWTCAPCVNCKRDVWYPPGIEIDIVQRGVVFMPVCSAECANTAIADLSDRRVG